jgi:hypothetical protein
MEDEITTIKRKIKEFYEDSKIRPGAKEFYKNSIVADDSTAPEPEWENDDSAGPHREFISKSLAKLAKKMVRKEYAIARKALKDQS